MHKLTREVIPAVQSSVMAIAQMDHFTRTATHGTFYSMSTSCEADITTFQQFFDATEIEASAARKARALGSHDLMLLDVDQASSRIFFKLAVEGLGRKKTMKVSVGSGRKLRRNDLTVVLSPAYVGDGVVDEQAPKLIDNAASTDRSAADSLCVLSNLGDPVVAAGMFLQWDG